MLGELLARTAERREEVDTRFTAENHPENEGEAEMEAEAGGARAEVRDAYGDPAYWDARYEANNKKETTDDGDEGAGDDDDKVGYEWLGDWEHLGPVLRAELRPTDEVLHVGCGDSALGTHLLDRLKMEEGGSGCVSRVLNTDISPVVIAQMQERYPEDEWQVMDVLDMGASGCSPSSFDVVLDKGTMDALLCADSVAEKGARARQMLAEVRRALRPGGRYICVSFGMPESRQRYLGEVERVHTIRGNKHAKTIYVYVLQFS